jgi:nitrogen fixation protein NifQ
MPPWIDAAGGAPGRRHALLATPGPDDADRADLACVVGLALHEKALGKGTLPDLLGLDRGALNGLAARWFPQAQLPDLDLQRAAPPPDQAAVAMLLRWRGGARSAESLWFADIIARRAMETRHLWEDLGLPSRPALTALMGRHFPRAVALNAPNMRWKKFFYRQICADAAFSLCLSPSCDECPEKAACFAPEADAH